MSSDIILFGEWQIFINSTLHPRSLSAPTLAKALDPDFTRRSRTFEEYAIAGVLHMDHMAEMASADAAHLLKRHALFLGPALGIEANVAAARLTALFKRHADEWSDFLAAAGASSFIRQWTRCAP